MGVVCTSLSISCITLMIIFMAKSQMHKCANPPEIQNKSFVTTNILSSIQMRFNSAKNITQRVLTG